MKAEPGKRYRHYKGREYTVLHIARLESNPDIEYVVYRSEYDAEDFKQGTIWIRERENFESQVSAQGIQQYRFVEIPETATDETNP